MTETKTFTEWLLFLDPKGAQIKRFIWECKNWEYRINDKKDPYTMFLWCLLCDRIGNECNCYEK